MGSELGEYPHKFGASTSSATESNNFKFVVVGFGEKLVKTTTKTHKLVGSKQTPKISVIKGKSKKNQSRI